MAQKEDYFVKSVQTKSCLDDKRYDHHTQPELVLEGPMECALTGSRTIFGSPEPAFDKKSTAADNPTPVEPAAP
ncbi:hypothetical protein P7K49_012695 [Saguinus oedipus]|uniref:Uncharacterized protein n=1 Tax=Saguinus oedipus TaxID=9490 RepID=A0ABQ9VEE3_SAGOE|nr:hypothetical protein P7K49_012695 [Saguinus oedipus]